MRSEPAPLGQLGPRLVQVHADPEHDRAVAGLGEDPADLLAAEHHVVRPLDLDREVGQLLERVGDRDPRDERELRQRPVRPAA